MDGGKAGDEERHECEPADQAAEGRRVEIIQGGGTMAVKNRPLTLSCKTIGPLPGGDPFGLFTDRNKCNTFVADVLEQTSVEIDPPIYGVYLASPPSANNWAGTHETSDPTSPLPIPGWKLTGDHPSPGYVTARGFSSGALGHCGIVDFDGQWISAGPTNVNRRADFVHYTSGGGAPASQRKR